LIATAWNKSFPPLLEGIRKPAYVGKIVFPGTILNSFVTNDEIFNSNIGFPGICLVSMKQTAPYKVFKP
jgi:hypothetical protein